MGTCADNFLTTRCLMWIYKASQVHTSIPFIWIYGVEVNNIIEYLLSPKFRYLVRRNPIKTPGYLGFYFLDSVYLLHAFSLL